MQRPDSAVALDTNRIRVFKTATRTERLQEAVMTQPRAGRSKLRRAGKALAKKHARKTATLSKRKETRARFPRSTKATDPDTPPRVPRDAELIVRQGFEKDATGRSLMLCLR